MTEKEAVKKVVDERSKRMREAIEDDILRKREKLDATIPETAWWHWRRKPYDGRYK